MKPVDISFARKWRTSLYLSYSVMTSNLTLLAKFRIMVSCINGRHPQVTELPETAILHILFIMAQD